MFWGSIFCIKNCVIVNGLIKGLACMLWLLVKSCSKRRFYHLPILYDSTEKSAKLYQLDLTLSRGETLKKMKETVVCIVVAELGEMFLQGGLDHSFILSKEQEG